MRRVGSREYKIMLQAERLVGDEAGLVAAAQELWGDFERAIGDCVLGSDGTLDEIDKRRTIRFLDSADHRLRACGYVFRERTGRRGREVTLKFRHPDRYLARDRDMRAARSGRSETKFEEDIKPTFGRVPFTSLYSFSTKQKIRESQRLEKLKHAGGLFPGLASAMGDAYRGSEPLALVGFAARELVVAGAEFRIGRKPKVECECALVAWYVEDGDPQRPLLAELSFQYGDPKEDFEGEPARRACEVFRILQGMDAWIDAKAKTKTARVYEAAGRSQPDADF